MLEFFKSKIFIFFLILFSSCTKQKIVENNLKSKSDIHVEKPNVLYNSNRTAYDVKQIFSEIEKETITEIYNSNISENPEIANAFLDELSNVTNEFFIKKYELDLKSFMAEGEVLDEEVINRKVIITGLVYAFLDVSNEIDIEGLENPEYIASLNDPESCFYTALGSFMGVLEIKNIVRLFRAGATQATIVSTIKLSIRRVATIITAITTLYQLGDCLDWW